MEHYLDFLRTILTHGVEKGDRTGTGTRSVFGLQMRFDLNQGFPLVTTKKCHTKSIIHELLWFLSGDCNEHTLRDKGVKIWSAWAKEDGDLGPIYGHQWRRWGAEGGREIDQMANLIEGLKTNPHSRRHIVNAWNVGQLDQMALPPCHAFFQFYVANDQLSCKLTQRSADAFLGVPFNIASYALLTHMVAQQVGLGVGDFIWSGGDCHIYLNHLEAVEEQLSRKPHPLPTLVMPSSKPDSLFDYTFEDFEIKDYVSHPRIYGAISV
jgi:thymidylate synthase